MPGRIVTPAEAIRRLGDFDKKRLRQAIRTGMAAGARKALQQARAEAEIKSRGLGRSLWGKRKALSHKKYMETFSPGKKARRRAGKFFAPGVAPLILEVSKIRTFGDRFRGGIQAAANAQLPPAKSSRNERVRS